MTTPAGHPAPAPTRLRGRVAVGVAVAWVVIGIVMGAQASLGAALSGAEPTPLATAITFALVQTVPWIPVTWAVIALAIRFPVTRAGWRRVILVHLAAAVGLAFAANALVVLGYWIVSGSFQSLAVLIREGARWMALRLHIGLMIYAAILAITQAVRYYRQTQDSELRLARLEGQLARARLQALNAQMRPHFLFNTLHTIGQLWRSGKADDAEVALDHLGSLFHKVHHSTNEFEVPLGDELAMVREYLAIESARFRDRLRAVVKAPDDVLDWMVPPLILQPLVENAVRHGLSAASTAGTIEVTATRHNGHLRLRVRDDGPGMAAATPQPGSGTGLANTRERLAQLYGVDGRLEIRSDPATGTTVTVTIPQGERS
jgi:two-component system LytT family sensor kinase